VQRTFRWLNVAVAVVTLASALAVLWNDLSVVGYQACYRDALRLNPAYADAHFYLAVTLEKNGQSQEARAHWRAYQRLAPNGEWVALAREFSE